MKLFYERRCKKEIDLDKILRLYLSYEDTYCCRYEITYWNFSEPYIIVRVYNKQEESKTMKILLSTLCDFYEQMRDEEDEKVRNLGKDLRDEAIFSIGGYEGE